MDKLILAPTANFNTDIFHKADSQIALMIKQSLDFKSFQTFIKVNIPCISGLYRYKEYACGKVPWTDHIPCTLKSTALLIHAVIWAERQRGCKSQKLLCMSFVL